jgi:hypothetical protein
VEPANKAVLEKQLIQWSSHVINKEDKNAVHGLIYREEQYQPLSTSQ